MANNNVEIEIQVQVENVKPLEDFLEKNGKLESEKHQHDEYFVPAHRNFLDVRPVGEWLRVRDAGGEYSLNYKNWHFTKDGKSYHCDEFETKIEDPDKMRKILKVLDFKPIVTVDKTRKSWLYEAWKISLDEIKGLGDFVEIEYEGKDNIEPEQETAKMVNFLKKLGCGKIKRNYGGYPFHLLFPEEMKFEVE